jgi:hypothetical protein
MNTVNPPQINLMLDDTLVGGNIDDMLHGLNNMRFQYLKQIDGTEENKLWFKFDELLNKTREYGSSYLGKGTVTLVCAIKKVKPVADDTKYVIRFTEGYPTEINDLIKNNYIYDKPLFEIAIPDIFCYGTIVKKDGQRVTHEGVNYVISKYYNTNFDVLTFEQTNKIFFNLLNLMDIARVNNLFFWDLKLANIGYDENFNCIMIDYDTRTVVRYPIDDIYYYGGTFKSVYITVLMAAYTEHGYLSQIKDYGTRNTRQERILPGKYHDMLGVGGLVDVIFGLYFSNKETLSDIIDKTKRVYNAFQSFYNFCDLEILRNNIANLNCKFNLKKAYADFYNDLCNLLIDENGGGLLSLYYNKVPKYSTIINKFSKYHHLTVDDPSIAGPSINDPSIAGPLSTSPPNSETVFFGGSNMKIYKLKL